MRSILRRSVTITVLTALASVFLAGCRMAWLSPSARCTACCHQSCRRVTSPAQCRSTAAGPAVIGLSDQTGVQIAGDTWAEHVFPQSFRLALRSPGGRFYALPTRPILEVPRVPNSGPTDSSRPSVEPEPIPTPPPLPQSSAPILAPQPPVANDWGNLSPPSESAAGPESQMPPLREISPPRPEESGRGIEPSESWLFALPAEQRVAIRTQSQQVVLPDSPPPNPAALRRVLGR